MRWSAGPIIDPDLFWHVRVGQQLFHHLEVPSPDPWAYTLPGHRWQSGAWLSEIVYYLLHRAGGYPALVGLRFIATAALLVSLAWQLHRRARPGIAAGCFLLASVPLLAYIQDRPQLFSLLFVVWLAGVLQRARTQGELPGVPHIAVVTWLWAMIHGLWVLLPAFVLFLAVTRVLDQGVGALPFARASLLRAAAAACAAGLTPVGPRLLLTPFALLRSTATISEWQPTSVHEFLAWGALGLTAVVVWCWARAETRAPRSELLFVGGVLLFGMWAIRNAGIAALLLAPVAADSLMAARPHPPITSRQLTVPRLFVAGLASVGVLMAAFSYVDAPVLKPSSPYEITARLARQPGTLRVLDDYNVSGYLIDRATPHVKVAIDGRSDRYGDQYIARYTAMVEMLGDWRSEVRNLHADVALLDTDRSPLADGLTHSMGWRVVAREGHYVLLTAPGVRLR